MDYERINKKLNSRGIKNVCEKCGGKKSINDQPIQITTGSRGNTDSFDGYATCCESCGHLDFYSARYLT